MYVATSCFLVVIVCMYLAHIHVRIPHIKRPVPMYIEGGELKHLSVSAYFVQCFISVCYALLMSLTAP